MSKTVQTILIALVVIFAAAGLLWMGIFFGRNTVLANPLPTWEMLGGAPGLETYQQQAGWMHPRRGMPGRSSFQVNPDAFPRHPGMMPSREWSTFRGQISELTIEQIREAALAYLDESGLEGLEIQEMMLFSHNGYVIIGEQDSGRGAFELLVDPATRSAFLEYGPTRMWNLKYGIRGEVSPVCMRGGASQPTDFQVGELDSSFSMPLSTEDAAAIAQDYLDRSHSGYNVTESVTDFYGYYTMDVEEADRIVGMVSVNGFTGEVFPHSWHGAFLEMVDSHR